MGIALFDMAALVGAAFAAHHFYNFLSELLNISPALSQALIFVIVGIILLFVSARIFAITQVMFSPFDAFLSFIFGVVAAWAFSYTMIEVIANVAGEESPTQEKIAESRVATEITQFRTITGAKALLDSARFIEREPGEQRSTGVKPSKIE